MFCSEKCELYVYTENTTQPHSKASPRSLVTLRPHALGLVPSASSLFLLLSSTLCEKGSIDSRMHRPARALTIGTGPALCALCSVLYREIPSEQKLRWHQAPVGGLSLLKDIKLHGIWAKFCRDR